MSRGDSNPQAVCARAIGILEDDKKNPHRQTERHSLRAVESNVLGGIGGAGRDDIV